MKNKILFLSIISVIFILTWHCGAENPFAPDTPGPDEIWFQNGAVTPRTLTVTSGTRVTWFNKDTDTHAVDSGTPMNPTGEFQSNNLDQGETFPHTFSTAGTFRYYCSIHQNRSAETGTVIVQ